MPWRRERLPTPVFLPGESHGQGSLASYSPWGHAETWHPHMATNLNQKQLGAGWLPPYLQLAPFSSDYSAFSRLEISFQERETWVRIEANHFCSCLSSVNTSHALNLASLCDFDSKKLIWLSLAFPQVFTHSLMACHWLSCVTLYCPWLWPLVPVFWVPWGTLYKFTKLFVKLCFQMVDHKINLVKYDQPFFIYFNFIIFKIEV